MSISTFKRLTSKNCKSLTELIKESKSLSVKNLKYDTQMSKTQILQAKGDITKIESLIGKLKDGQTRFLNKIKLQMEDEEYKTAAEEVQTHIEDEQLEELIDEATDMIVELKLVILEGETKEKELMEQTRSQYTQQDSQTTSPPQVGNQQTGQDLKLPTFQIPIFEGDPTTFARFWSVFEQSVDRNANLSGASKLIHLNSYLKGEASLILTNMEMTDDNYKKAVELLKELYSTNTSLRDLEMKLARTPKAAENAKSLRSTYMEIKAILTMIKEKESVDNISLLTTVQNKFPAQVRTQLRKKEFEEGSGEWNTTKWIKELLKIIQWEEHNKPEETEMITTNTYATHTDGYNKGWHKNTSYRQRDNNSGNRHKHAEKKFSKNTIKNTRKTEVTSNKRECYFCYGDHLEINCTSSLELKRELVMWRKACWKCFSPDHISSQCGKPDCSKCGRNHHISLCRKIDNDTENKNTQKDETRTTFMKSRVRSPSPWVNKGGQESTTLTATQKIPEDESEESDESESDEEDHDGKLEETYVNHIKVNTGNPPRLMMTKGYIPDAKGRRHEQTILIDSGSQRSFITDEVATNLKLKILRTETLRIIGIGGKTTEISSKVVELKLYNGTGDHMEIQMNTTKTITTPFKTTRVQDEERNMLRSLHLHEDNTEMCGMMHHPAILIGIDNYWEIMTPGKGPKKVKLPSGLMWVNSFFGGILSGQEHQEGGQNEANTQTYAINKAIVEDRTDCTEMWKLDLIGIKDRTDQHLDEETNKNVLEQFNQTAKLENEYYSVKFPWKEDHPPISDNYYMAQRRLEALFRKINNQDKIKQEYHKILTKQLEDGILEEATQKVNGRVVYYIPHQAVVKEQSKTTKVRIVMDASSHCRNTLSLNDIIHQGPTILPNICGTMLRSRTHKILILADVEKAFLQVRLQETERDATRILWVHDLNRPPLGDNARVFRYTRVPFGVNASPFLLAATIQLHLSQHREVNTARQILENLYVDNMIVGTNEVEQGKTMCKVSKEIFNEIKMNLREYTSNESKVIENMNDKDKSGDTEDSKILGIKWNIPQDTLDITLKCHTSGHLTKRKVVSASSSTYDPLGLTSPLFVEANLFAQKLWERKHDWDDTLPEDLSKKWITLTGKIMGEPVRIPRKATTREEGNKYSLAIFGDASQHTYAACAYLLTQNGQGHKQSHLVMSRSRLAPPENISIPKLELIAAFIATKLAKFLIQELHIQVDEVHFFSDSLITLYWMQAKQSLRLFVKNKVDRINENIQGIKDKGIKVETHYVPTKQNPADHATRGLSREELTGNGCNWWNGPEWLLGAQSNWPGHKTDFNMLSSKMKEEINKEVRVNTKVA